jgi:hypothetical protein
MKLYNIEMDWVEFFWKVFVVLGFIVPICIGGASFVFFSLSPADNFILRVGLTTFGAIVGTVTAIFLTAMVIKLGHKEE